MKRFYLLLSIVAFIAVNNTYGQAIQVSTGDTIQYSGALSNINASAPEQDVYLVNNTSDSAIYWQALSVNEDSTWQMSFCDPNNCYYYSLGLGLGNYGLNQFTALPNSTSRVQFGITPYCVADSSKMAVRIWVAKDSAASAKTLYFFANYSGGCATAIQTVTAPSLRIYPSPVISNLSVEGLGSYSNVKVTVYDILGNTVIQKNVAQPANVINLNTDGLYAGVYIVSVESEGTKLLTKRIQKLD